MLPRARFLYALSAYIPQKKTSTLSNLQLERNGERVGVGEYRLNTHPAIFTAIVAQLARGLQSTGFVG